MVQRIPLQGKRAYGRVALIDDQDLPLVSPYRWYAHEYHGEGRHRVHGPYAVTFQPPGVKPHALFMHGIILQCERVDHADGDGLNNRRANLRPATRSQNGANSGPRRGTSKFKGVSWDKRDGYWRAQITVDHRIRLLGRFGLDEEAAARAYDAAALAAWGEYARLNFPRGL